MEVINFEGENPRPNDYVPFTPPFVQKAIKSVGSIPPLIMSGGPKEAEYTVSEIPMTARIHLVGTDNPFDLEVPLAMCNYVRPEGDNIYDPEICREADFENIRRERHNRFIVDLFSAFMERNDCGASARRMTAPEAPPDCTAIRLQKIKELSADKYGTAKKAIEFLAARKIYCELDYEFSAAFETANDVSFKEIVSKRAESGRVRVRLEGKPPSWWDGTSLHDSAGNPVRWYRGKGHTFLTPEVTVVMAESTGVTIINEN